ncbi:MAG: hypothetical protein KIH63_000490 [Candidatus Saccharibacteria bacterium]|nr:hypothetical protein [Candidatus Saccharibacteria bacterium]
MNYSICVSGAAAGKTVDGARDLAERVGAAIAKSGHTITTGATVGLSFYAAKAAKDAGGTSIGFSPANSLREHMHKYRLPIGVYDFVNFTGMQYVGRDVHLVQSSDAVITVGGRFGSLHEFTTAFEMGRPCGILVGSGGTADLIPELLERIKERPKGHIIIDENPENLVKKVVAFLDEEFADIDTEDYINQWFLKASKGSHTG